MDNDQRPSLEGTRALRDQGRGENSDTVIVGAQPPLNNPPLTAEELRAVIREATVVGTYTAEEMYSERGRRGVLPFGRSAFYKALKNGEMPPSISVGGVRCFAKATVHAWLDDGCPNQATFLSRRRQRRRATQKGGAS